MSRFNKDPLQSKWGSRGVAVIALEYNWVALVRFSQPPETQARGRGSVLERCSKLETTQKRWNYPFFIFSIIFHSLLRHYLKPTFLPPSVTSHFFAIVLAFGCEKYISYIHSGTLKTANDHSSTAKQHRLPNRAVWFLEMGVFRDVMTAPRSRKRCVLKSRSFRGSAEEWAICTGMGGLRRSWVT